MLQPTYESLLNMARRQSRGAVDAENLLQDGLIEAIRTARADLSILANRRWLSVLIRNRARIAADAAARTRQQPHAPVADISVTALLISLPPDLKSVATLSLTGHSRREIAQALQLDDAILRQRVAALGKRLRAAGLPLSAALPGLGLERAYARLREALLPALLQEATADTAAAASHSSASKTVS